MMRGRKEEKYSTQSRKLAFWLSIGCAIHCVSWPVILALMPLAASRIPYFHELEYVLVGLSVLFGAWVLIPTYLRERNPIPGLLALLGLGLLLFPHMAHLPEYWAFPGAILMAVAQILNLKKSSASLNQKAHIIDIAPARKLGRKAG